MSNRAGSRQLTVHWAHAYQRSGSPAATPRRRVVRRAGAAHGLRAAFEVLLHVCCVARRVRIAMPRERSRSHLHACKRPAGATGDGDCAWSVWMLRAIPAAFDISYLNCAHAHVLRRVRRAGGADCGLHTCQSAHWCEQMRSHCVCGSLYDPLACSRALSIALW